MLAGSAGLECASVEGAEPILASEVQVIREFSILGYMQPIYIPSDLKDFLRGED